MTSGIGLTVALTPVIAAICGSVALFLRRGRLYRAAAERSRASRAEIDQILLAAKIREAKAREADAAEKPA